MTIAEIIANAKKQGVDVLDAELLVSDVLALQQSYVLAHPELELTDEQEKTLMALLTRRANNEPLAYLTKSKEFFGLPLYVDQHVLVPRPESEEAVSWLLEKAAAHPLFHILDVGTGSGALALALAKNLSQAQVTAIDVKHATLDVARKNAKNLALSNVTFLKSNLLEALGPEETFDAVIANLPYLSYEWQRDPSTQHEPEEALYASENGLGLYKKLLEEIPKHLNERACGIFEADPRNTEELYVYVQEKLPNFNVELRNDLASLPRFVTFEK